jgi:predicted dehydrogenase/threonine dehydrogenase-like Zn-dependent dehydrogenase
MKQVLRKGLKEIIVDEVPDPVATPHHVLIRPVFSLISSGTETASIHTDSLIKEVAERPSVLQTIFNVAKTMGPFATFREVRAKFSEYAVLGYSGAGVVVGKHPTVTDLKIGERVAYGGEGTGHGETIVTGRNLTARAPAGIAFEHAAFATLGAIAMNSVRVANLGLGDHVAVIGLGLVGQLVAQLARLTGAVVTGIDLKPNRLDLARSLGCHHVIPGGAAAKDAVLGVTGGRGADCVIVAAASKSPAPAQQALEICRDRGRIVIVGAVAMEFPWEAMYLKEIQLLMARAYGPGSYDPLYEKRGQDYPLPYVRWTENRNMEEFMRLVVDGGVKLDPLITDRFKLDDAPTAYSKILEPNTSTLAVVLEYDRIDPESFDPKRTVEAPAATAPAPSGKDQLGVALAGASGLARWQHLPNLKKISGLNLRSIFSSSGARAKSYANRFGAATAVSDYNEMLRDSSIDLVVITSKNQEHAKQAAGALRAGKHVFVEKPMALTVEECRDIYQATKESGKQLTVGFNRRYAPYYVETKRALSRRSGPAVVMCRVNSPGISGSFWMADPSIGGAILGEACHFVDLMYWMLESEPLSVSCYSLPTDKKAPVGTNNLVASFRFADGSVGNLTYCTIGSKTSGGERVEVFAEGIGAFTADFKQLSIAGARRSDKSRWFPEKGLLTHMQSFVDGIRKGNAPECDVIDGARSTIGCLAMLESARTLQPVDIEVMATLNAANGK